ncbi:type IV secretion system protein [Yersinia ruckeri]|uniref:type IV secretion system protein n=1 Tax=Yersinia ruckeri TaxID=29486 RepID=UPI0022371109|nr:type IV secretion system protein [Yersinia ruckeri]MCW6572921.1 type IV secretion system protein [Yersinia ruckeri]HDL7537462.1 type IV secretion system protein [Yersinia enterocolitica]
MDVQIAQILYQAIDDSLKSTIATGTANLMAATGVIFGTFWLISLTIKSIYWLFQGLDVIFQDLLLSIGKASFIIFFAFNVGWYLNTIVPIVNELPNGVTQLLSASGQPQTNQVDAAISTFFEAVGSIIGAMEFSIWDEIGAFLLGILGLVFFLAGGLPFLLICVGTLITLKTASSILLVVGPVFIIFSLYDNTRQWFFGWLSVICGFMLTQIFFGIVITMQFNFINNFILNEGKLDTTLLGCFTTLIVFGAFTMLATELPTYAASIMGGAPSGGVGGVGGLLGRTMGTRAAGGMSRAVGRKILSMRNRNKIS